MPETCPDTAQLLNAAFDPGAAPDAVTRHLVDCRRCQEALSQIRTVAEAADSDREEGADCLDEEALARFVGGGMAGEERAVAVAHLFTCPHCRDQISALAELMAAPAIATEIRRLDARPARWKVLSGAGLVAAAALLLLVVPRAPPGVSAAHRGPTITAAAAPIPIGPVGSVSEARRLAWTPVDGADRYRVTL
ncbi:MAG TPA: zf-HC2 domain-containing protein, partial [Gemmatimonadales bacterium]|nr:zf-HC2 domain-containing protein [Gemmatimonadales bacterium]